MQNTQFAQNNVSPMAPQTMNDTQLTTLKPALFARYGALENLRYDYPLVLVDSEDQANLLRPLSRIIDDVLRAVAPQGPSGEELRQQVLSLEQRMREYVSQGREENLSDLWHLCEMELVEESGEDRFGPLDQNLDLARQKIKVDGKVIGCDGSTPSKILSHSWKAMHKFRARRFRNKVDGLILRLTDILKSDHMKSEEAHGATALAASMGADGDGSIDFSALSGVLHRARPEDRLPTDRVARIKHAMRVLQSQAFFGPGRASYSEPGHAVCYNYVFKSCSEALDAYRERLPSMVDFTKALTIAELEVDNKYVSSLHDTIFDRFDESDLTAEQMDLLPPAMIYLRDGITDSAEIARVYEALACGLPIKVLIQIDDILGPTSPEPPLNSFGAGTARLATMAIGLNNAFVMQTTSAHLYRMRDSLMHGMQYGGPAVFSLYSGATATAPDIPPYILAAAATESRAFPNFTFDPSAGTNWAGRFDLSQNPQNLTDWPEHDLLYEDQAGNSKTEHMAFTFGDFAICDSRYRRFCHEVPRTQWRGDMVPLADWLKVPKDSNDIQSPYVFGVESDKQLLRVVVDDKIISAARRCNDAWGRLQELAGINNSHAQALLAEERKKREALARELAANVAAAPVFPAVPVAASLPVAPAAGEAAPEIQPEASEDPDHSDGLAWIETPRCTTCNECTQVSNTLFAYNENMQAYVKDPDGGTYRQLVEAAESCQVSIIHPGLPRNPDEPDLEDLMQRAEIFN
ncbi:ferredoxin [Cohaesibacter celericrescens]|nr:ferredoxin [Cohaesibacter celericrescens]